MKVKELQFEINDKIFDEEVRVIDFDGSALGLMSSLKARNLAYERGLDLVKMPGDAKPAVCKILDYGKFCFERTKKEKEMRKNQHTVGLKEIRLSVNIGENDLKIKAARTVEFVKNGNRVKILIRFRGREQGHAEIGLDVMKKFFNICTEMCGDAIIMEKEPKQETRNMFMFLGPNPKNKKNSCENSHKSTVSNENELEMRENNA